MCSRCLAIMRGLTSGARDGDACAARADELEDLHLAVGELGEFGGTGRAEEMAGRLAAASAQHGGQQRVADGTSSRSRSASPKSMLARWTAMPMICSCGPVRLTAIWCSTGKTRKNSLYRPRAWNCRRDTYMAVPPRPAICVQCALAY